jgi:hypothetical protein
MQGSSCEQCGCNRSMCTWVSILLFIGGLAHALPPLYNWLSNLTNGSPIIQVVVGILSVIVAIMVMSGHRTHRK